MEELREPGEVIQANQMNQMVFGGAKWIYRTLFASKHRQGLAAQVRFCGDGQGAVFLAFDPFCVCRLHHLSSTSCSR